MSGPIATAPFRMGRTFHRHGDTAPTDGLFDSGACTLNPQAVRAWLSLGFVPGDATVLEGVSCLPGGVEGQIVDGKWQVDKPYRLAPLDLPRTEAELAELANTYFDDAVDGAYSACPGPHVVPLSGGLDSRILLGALLERIPARSIVTYTYGISGSADFEIGNRVAAAAGTDHVRIELDRAPTWTRADLEQVARLTDANNSLFHPAVWLRVLELVGRDVTLWTGYTGDGIGGSFAGALRGAASEDPRLAFLRHELSVQPAWPFKASPAQLRDLCVEGSALESLVARPESTWFANHVERYTTHHIYLRGLRYASPFMAEPVVRLFCSLPLELRLGKRFFNDWSRRRWPRLFGLPTKDYGWGLAGGRARQVAWRAGTLMRKAGHRLLPAFVSHPHNAYWSFETELRRAPLRDLVHELLMELHSTGVWDRAEWGDLWRRQQAGERWGTVLLNGASLGIVQAMAARAETA